MTMRKKIVSATWMSLLVLGQQSRAWQPSGWAYLTTGPNKYAYDFLESQWYYLNPTDTMYCYDYSSGTWSRMGENTVSIGWSYFMWPYVYSLTTGGWFYCDRNATLYCFCFANGKWSALGTPSGGSVLIPAGSFTMGDAYGEGGSNEQPQHTVAVSAFRMDRYEVTKELWDEVAKWAYAHGYDILFTDVPGKAPSHPVYDVDWFTCTKWANARSEMEGLAPCYYVGGNVYRTSVNFPTCSWDAVGYRLPTEAEWEKAARGGASGRRFPWTDSDTIAHGRANYNSDGSTAYDTSSTRGYHPTYDNYPRPCTSPVGSFAPNGYGLHDMAGNVAEWCWDAWDASYYTHSPTVDPRGGDDVYNGFVIRGGTWYLYASQCRVASRWYHQSGNYKYWAVGFRLVRKAQ
jgi:formylglycine-generating enzyme required for sulfatase activity